MAPRNLNNGGLLLTSHADDDSFAGDYIKKSENSSPRNLRRFRNAYQELSVYVDPTTKEVKADHFYYGGLLGGLTLHYTFVRKAEGGGTAKSASEELKPEPLLFLDIARDDSGHIIPMDQYDAIEYCTQQKARLPTARELADLARREYHAKGIVEKCGPDEIPDSRQNTCWDIDEIKGSFSFKYSNLGFDAYQKLRIPLWSSSVYSGDSSKAFSLDPSTYGMITPYMHRFVEAGVRCVTDRHE